MRSHTPRLVTYFTWILLAVLALGQPATRGPVMAPSEVLGVHAAADNQELRGKTYVAIGDSIAAGRYATTADKVFPALIAQRLGMNLVLVAHSGAKAGWALPQLPAVSSAQPALVTIELGTNDVGFATPPDLFRSQYESIMAAIATGTNRVICIGSWLPSPGFDAIIADVCERHGGTFVSLDGFYWVNDFHAEDGGPSYLGRADWFHPGNQGHAAIAAAVLADLGAGAPPRVIPDRPTPTPVQDVIRTHPY